MDLAFIYAKDGKVRCLNLEQANSRNEKLKADGWKHTATLNLCVWLEFLMNDLSEANIVTELKKLLN